ncbi:MAG: UDP-N-acetylmuramoyl-L-alanine--D-glutamate ligase [Gammaproteobacteria bacterium]|nr:UDP-N-acetylmuramoyl-L-alanine--D-glutamate ligase [Gammaproteobacteria bacterium]
MHVAAAHPYSVIVGLGLTGVSCARHLAARGHRLAVTDSRAAPPGLAELNRIAPQARLALGGFDPAVLAGADQIVVSPGVPASEPFLRAAVAQGIELVGDIELFAREVGGRVVGITGSNGKSTVTALLGEMARAAGIDVRVGGNLGPPALDLLAGPPAALYVLELSSFQLETTWSLQPEVATVLNVTPDHLDRYPDVAGYAAAKARIFERAVTAVVNQDDPLVVLMPRPGQRRVGFSVTDPAAEYALCQRPDGEWLVAAGEPLLPLARLRLPGRHNAANALAALAIGDLCGWPRAAMVDVLERFAGLPHRTEHVRSRRGVHWIDDSKGTNVGATAAAIAGLAGPLLLIAGGDGKQQDFAPLAAACRGKVRQAILIGRDAPVLARALADCCAVTFAATLPAAVGVAAGLARPGDTVLLSPACASFDMFRNFAERGAVFTTAVRELPA